MRIILYGSNIHAFGCEFNIKQGDFLYLLASQVRLGEKRLMIDFFLPNIYSQ